MPMGLKHIVAKALREVADKIDSGTCELTETEAMDIMKAVAHESMSKDQACTYLNISPSKFGELIRQNKLPKGKKVRGFKELRFWKDELDVAKAKMKYEKDKL